MPIIEMICSANLSFGMPPGLTHGAYNAIYLHGSDELKEKYQTIIGERGVRLSGGQRQRIGIARALYNNPKVLVLDEATNALDIQTENAVINALKDIGKDITIILITHRLDTLINCDIIFKLEKGYLANSGTYDEIINLKKNVKDKKFT